MASINQTKAPKPRALAHLAFIDQLEPVVGDTAVNMATVMGFPCAVPAGSAKRGDLAIFIATDAFVPRTPNNMFLFDGEINRYHLHETKLGQKKPTNEDNLVDGLRVKPVVVSGQISYGLAIGIAAHPAVRRELEQAFGGVIPPHKARSDAASILLTERFGLQKWTQTVAFEVVWDRPDFIPSPAVQVMNTATGPRRQADDKYLITFPPSDYTPTTIYFLREDSHMAKSLAHRDTSKVIPGVGRVGVCNARFDFMEMFSHPGWGSVMKDDIVDKLVALNENIAIEGYYVMRTVKATRGASRTTRTFSVCAIWNLDTRTCWPWTDVVKKAREWGLQLVPNQGLMTFDDITQGKAKKYEKDENATVFRSQDGRDVFSLQ